MKKENEQNDNVVSEKNLGDFENDNGEETNNENFDNNVDDIDDYDNDDADDDDSDDSDDNGDWISPSNISQVKADLGVIEHEVKPSNVLVGCLTTDFAMQVKYNNNIQE